MSRQILHLLQWKPCGGETTTVMAERAFLSVHQVPSEKVANAFINYSIQSDEILRVKKVINEYLANLINKEREDR